MTPDVFLRGPAPAWLLGVLLVDGALAAPPPPAPPSWQQVARPTVTLPHRVLNVVPLPRPTAVPRLHGRVDNDNDSSSSSLNTICGYIGGNVDLPATCSAGSHCVLDAAHGAVGCCPNGAAACTAGVFTGCVDGAAAAAQTVANPYVYTCSGADVCYRNTFGDGYFQYGCAAAGAASTLVHAVAAAADGHSAALESERVLFTGVYSGGSGGASSLTTSSSTSSTSSPTSTTSSSPSNASANAPTLENHHRVGVIVGATIGSIFGLLLLLALLAFCLLRRRRNQTRNDSDDDARRFGEKDPYSPRDAPPAYGSPADTKNSAAGSFGTRSASGSLSVISHRPTTDDLVALHDDGSKGGPTPRAQRRRSASSPAPSSRPSLYAAARSSADVSSFGRALPTALHRAAALRDSMVSSAGSRISRLSRLSQLSEDGDGDGDGPNWSRSATAHLRTLSYPPPGSYRQLSPYGDYPALSGSEGDVTASSPEPAYTTPEPDSDSTPGTVRRRPPSSRPSSQSYYSADSRPLVAPPATAASRPGTSHTLRPGAPEAPDGTSEGPAWV